MKTPELTSFFKIRRGCNWTPEEVKVTRFTDRSVWIYYPGRTPKPVSRDGSYECYYPTLKEAIEAQIANLKGTSDYLRKKIAANQESLKKTDEYLASLADQLAKREGDYHAYTEPPSINLEELI
jgi:hypothetical protein